MSIMIAHIKNAIMHNHHHLQRHHAQIIRDTPGRNGFPCRIHLKRGQLHFVAVAGLRPSVMYVQVR